MRTIPAAQPLRSLPIAVPQGNPWLAYARASTFTIWFFSLVVNYWWRQQWDDIYEMRAAGIDLREQYFIGFGIALIGHLTLGPVKWVNTILALPSTASGKALLVFFLYLLVLTPFSINPRVSGQYLLATFGVLLLCSLFWASDFRILRRVLVFTGLVLFSWLILLLLHHGLAWGFGSNIGGINRNMIGRLALVAMVCMLFSDKKELRWAAIGLAAAFSIIVTSRGSLLALTVFLAVYYVLSKGTMKAAWHAAMALFLVGFALLASSFLQKAVFEDVLQIHDERRGIGTGFTGRFDELRRGFELSRSKPMFGYGFRSAAARDGSAPRTHIGYINLLLETGVIGTFLILGAVALSMFQRIRLIQQVRRLLQQQSAYRRLLIDTLKLNAIAVATLCAVATLWLYEPLYINLGNVASLLFFLMIASPMWPSSSPRDLTGYTYHRTASPAHN